MEKEETQENSKLETRSSLRVPARLGLLLAFLSCFVVLYVVHFHVVRSIAGASDLAIAWLLYLSVPSFFAFLVLFASTLFQDLHGVKRSVALFSIGFTLNFSVLVIVAIVLAVMISNAVSDGARL